MKFLLICALSTLSFSCNLSSEEARGAIIDYYEYKSKSDGAGVHHLNGVYILSIEDKSDSTTKVLARTTGSYSNKSLAKPVKRKIDDKMYYHIDCINKKVIRRERFKEED